jgi:hypothetical protein
MNWTTEIYQLLREARFSLIRFEEDEDVEALDDTIDMLVDIQALVDPADSVEAPPLDRRPVALPVRKRNTLAQTEAR